MTIMRSEFHFEAFKFLLIESRFLAVELTGANAPPCCVSMASDALNKTIFDWRLFYGSSLAKAAVSALDSMFVKASDTDPLRPRIGNRYRYGNSEYEVTSVIDNRILLRSTDSPRRDAAELNVQDTPSLHRKAPPNRFFIARPGVSERMLGLRPSPRPHKRLDRQPKAIQQIVLQELHSSDLKRGLSGQLLASIIICQIAHLNKSLPSDKQLKVPSFSTLRVLIRELREQAKHPL
jgi:hypothetical protein